MKTIFTFLFLLNSFFLFAQNSVDVTAKWKVNDSFKVQFSSEITDYRNREKKSTKSTFDSKFTVNTVLDSEIKITWIYNAAHLDAEENDLENIITSKILNQPLNIKLSESGQFVSLENTAEIKKSITEIIDKERAKTTVASRKALLDIAQNILKTDEGTELLVTKNIKAYLFSFGYNFIINKPETHDLEIANPFGGENFSATETVEMTDLKEDLKICTVKTHKTANGDQIKTSVINALKKVSSKNAGEIDAELSGLALEFSENTEHIIDYNVGIVNKGFFKRVMNFGFQNRIQLLNFSIVK